MPEKFEVTLEIYEGDGAWAESGLITPAQMLNGAAMELIGCTFGEEEDWWKRSIVMWEIHDEDKLRVTFTTASGADNDKLVTSAVRVFHHTVVH
jgi:hypothetical protein